MRKDYLSLSKKTLYHCERTYFISTITRHIWKTIMGKKKKKETKENLYHTVRNCTLLLSHTGKICAKIIEQFVKHIVDQQFSPWQFGFRWGPSCTYVLFTMRQVSESTIEYNKEFNIWCRWVICGTALLPVKQLGYLWTSWTTCETAWNHYSVWLYYCPAGSPCWYSAARSNMIAPSLCTLTCTVQRDFSCSWTS